MAVVGHDWSVFIRFGGGIGLSTLAGALLYRSPAIGLGASAALLLLWVALTQLLHIHRARATVLTMAAVGPLLWALGFPIQDVLLGALGAVVVIVKTLPDWSRQYGPQPG
jgi:glycerol-3-phosphate acyltransferase PlsY